MGTMDLWVEGGDGGVAAVLARVYVAAQRCRPTGKQRADGAPLLSGKGGGDEASRTQHIGDLRSLRPTHGTSRGAPGRSSGLGVAWSRASETCV